MTDRLRRWWRRALVVGTALTAPAAGTHVAVRDSYVVTAPITYATPWPLALAVALGLAMDHVWLPPAFAVVSADKRWTVQSDHAMVLVTFVRK